MTCLWNVDFSPTSITTNFASRLGSLFLSWLAREIGCTRNHVYKIFHKSSLDGELILRISNTMNFNFFQYYTAAFLEGMKARMGEE